MLGTLSSMKRDDDDCVLGCIFCGMIHVNSLFFMKKTFLGIDEVVASICIDPCSFSIHVLAFRAFKVVQKPDLFSFLLLFILFRQPKLIDVHWIWENFVLWNGI